MGGKHDRIQYLVCGRHRSYLEMRGCNCTRYRLGKAMKTTTEPVEVRELKMVLEHVDGADPVKMAEAQLAMLTVIASELGRIRKALEK